jgi:hypothetical protein
MLKITTIALVAVLSLGPGRSFAHGEPPQASHGGQVQEAHENWVELVVSRDEVRLYVLDEAKKPVPSSQVTGTATVLVGGKPYKVQLSPMDANGLQGKLPVAVTGKTAATVSLKIHNQPATARFTFES